MKKADKIKRIESDREVYGLVDSKEYWDNFREYQAGYERQRAKFGSVNKSSVPNKNMLVALRMMPAMNTPEDWARLHATELL